MNAPGGDSVALNLLVDDKGTLQKIEGSVGEVRQQFVEAEKHAEGFRARMMTLRNTLRDLALEGKTNTDEYKGMAKELGRMDEAMKRVAMSQNLLNPERKAAAFGAMARTVAEGFHGAAAAAVIFAGKNEELQNVIMKVMELQAAASGIQSIVELRHQAAILSTIFLKKKEIAVTLESEAATGKLSVATRIWNAITAVNPWFILIGVLVAAAGVMASLSIAADLHTKSIKKQNEELSDLLDSSEKNNKSINEAISEEIRHAEAMGKSTDEINRMKKAYNELQISQLEQANTTLELQRKNNKELEEATIKSFSKWSAIVGLVTGAGSAVYNLLAPSADEVKAAIKNTDEITNKIAENNNKIAKLKDESLEGDKKISDQREKDLKKRLAELKKIQDEGKKQFDQEKNEELQREQKQANELGKLKVSNMRDANQKALAEAKLEYQDKLKDIADSDTNAGELRAQIEQEYANKVTDIQNKAAQDNYDATKKRNQEELDAAQKVMDAKISIAESTVKGLTALSDLLSVNGKKNQGVVKALALAQIAADEAKAIGSLVSGAQAAAAQAAIISGGAGALVGIAYYAQGFASILSGVAAAKAALNGSETSGSTAPTSLGGNAGAAITAPIQSQRTMLSEAQRRHSYNTVYKTYVVASDMTKAQATEEKLKTRRIH